MPLITVLLSTVGETVLAEGQSGTEVHSWYTLSLTVKVSRHFLLFLMFLYTLTSSTVMMIKGVCNPINHVRTWRLDHLRLATLIINSILSQDLNHMRDLR